MYQKHYLEQIQMRLAFILTSVKTTPYQFRSMVDLKNELSKFTVVKYDKKLAIIGLGHDKSIPFHVDNAADQSIFDAGIRTK
jgi:hypothetical protein